MRAGWYDNKSVLVDVKEKRIEKEGIVLETMESIEIESKKDIRRKPYGKCITENDTSLSLSSPLSG